MPLHFIQWQKRRMVNYNFCYLNVSRLQEAKDVDGALHVDIAFGKYNDGIRAFRDNFDAFPDDIVQRPFAQGANASKLMHDHSQMPHTASKGNVNGPLAFGKHLNRVALVNSMMSHTAGDADRVLGRRLPSYSAKRSTA